MSIVYFDCFSGASGDMLAGALVDAGADFDALVEIVSSLGLEGFTMKAEKTVRGPLSGTDFKVEISQKQHHHRGLSEIVKIIENSKMPQTAKDISTATFEKLASAEAGIHGKKIEEIHFHEVGAIDSIVDIAAISASLHLLNIQKVTCSALPLGSGNIETAHGKLPLPAPATVRLLSGAKTFPGGRCMEMTTPTAAAFLSNTSENFGAIPPMTIISDGYGAGDRTDSVMPNMLRAIVGEESDEGEIDIVVELSANLDDCEGEIIGHTINTLLEHGCLDAWACPVYTKKGRPAWLLGALCLPERVMDAESHIFRETTTFGIRKREMSRRKLKREIKTVETEWGPITVKTGFADGSIVTIAPEYEDCRLASEAHDISLRKVMYSARKAAEKGE